MARLLPFALLAAAVAAVASLLVLDAGTPSADGTFLVTIQGPEGELHNGTVRADAATAYSVLLVAAAEAGLDVEATGRGEDLFVVRIGPYANDGAAGWCYALWDDGSWRHPPHSAGVAGLQDGQAVQWSYEPSGCGAFA